MMRKTSKSLKKKLSFVGALASIIYCLQSTHFFDSRSFETISHRKLLIKEICNKFWKPYFKSLLHKYIFDYILDEEDEDNGIDNILVSFSSSDNYHSFIGNETESTRVNFCSGDEHVAIALPLVQILDKDYWRKLLQDYIICKLGSDVSSDTVEIVEKRQSNFYYLSCCSDSNICHMLLDDFNPTSTCFQQSDDPDIIEWKNDDQIRKYTTFNSLPPINYTVDQTDVVHTQNFNVLLTQEGFRVGLEFHRWVIQSFLLCRYGYKFDSPYRPYYSVEFDFNSHSLEVTCFSCSEFCNSVDDIVVKSTYCDECHDYCLDLKENFLSGVCRSSDQISQGLYIHDPFESCELGQPDNTLLLSLPSEYFPQTLESDEIIDEINTFLGCRSHMGAYQNFTFEQFPSLSYIGLNENGMIEVNCLDQCSNHAFCSDIQLQFESEFQCVTKYSCNDDLEDKLEINYLLSHLHGQDLESSSLTYSRDLEISTKENLIKYIQCRFKNDARFNNDDFLVIGSLERSDFDAFCRNSCNTIPYCDALRNKRKDDPEDDFCFDKYITMDSNARVETFYHHEFEFAVGNDGITQSFSYNVQSVTEDPVVRQYYGTPISSSLDELSATEMEAQKNDLEDLLENYDINVNSVLFENFCSDLTEYVTCASNGQVVKLDIEITEGVNNFKLGEINDNFGDELKSLILGGHPTKKKTLHRDLFSLQKLETLVLRLRGKLGGRIPQRLGDSHTLRNLDLNQCPFLENAHEGLIGTIPNEIQNLSSLKLIDLGCNKLTGTIPEGFFLKSNGQNSKSYKVINLNDNHLSGTISSKLGEITSMTQLSLARNSLSGNLDMLANNNQLKLLDLQHNEFTGRLPLLLKSALDLEVVALNDNNLTGRINSRISRLENLQYLNLKNNDLRGDIPESLSNCKNLKVLLLGGNDNLNFDDIPQQLRDFLDANEVVHDLY